jgi:hypothetical protein
MREPDKVVNGYRVTARFRGELASDVFAAGEAEASGARASGAASTWSGTSRMRMSAMRSP